MNKSKKKSGFFMNILNKLKKFSRQPNAGFIGILIWAFVATLIVLILYWSGYLHYTPEKSPPAPAYFQTKEEQTYISKDCAADIEKRYELTDAERWEIASVITAEAVGEPYAGKMAVAQCVLQSCEDDGIRPAEALIEYGYSTDRPEPCEEALEAVAAVFDFGQVVTYEPIKYFYAPKRTSGDWHETQVYILTINNHKFFKEAK